MTLPALLNDTLSLPLIGSPLFIISNPDLVDRLRNPESDTDEALAETLTPIDIDSKDEIGQLATSFNEVQRVAGEVAAESRPRPRYGLPSGGEQATVIMAPESGATVAMAAATRGVGVDGIWRGGAPMSSRQATSRPSTFIP